MAQLRQSGVDRLAGLTPHDLLCGGGGGNGASSEHVGVRIPYRQGGGRIRRPGHKGGGQWRVSVFTATVTIALGLLVSLSILYYLVRDREVQGRLDDEREQDNQPKRAAGKEPRPRLDRSMAFKKLRFGKGSVVVGRDSMYWDRDDRRRVEDYDGDSPELSNGGGVSGSDGHMAEDEGRRRKTEQLVINNGRVKESDQRKSRRGLCNEAGRTELKEYKKYEESVKKLEKSGQEGSRGEEVNSSDEYDDSFDIEDANVDDSNDVEHEDRGHLREVVDLDSDSDCGSGPTVSSSEEVKGIEGTSKGKISRSTNVVPTKSGGDAKTGHDGEMAKSSSSGKQKAGVGGNPRRRRFSAGGLYRCAF